MVQAYGRVLRGTEALGAVGLEELLDDVLGLRVEVPQDLHLQSVGR